MFGIKYGLGYVNARVKGLESKLLNDRDYSNLKNVKTLDSFVTLLQETSYRKELIEYPKHTGSVSFVLDSFKKNYDYTLKKIESYTPHKYYDFLDYFDFDELCRDVKKVFSKLLLNERTSLNELYSTSSNKFIAKLLEAPNSTEFLKILKRDQRFSLLHDLKHYLKRSQDFYHDVDLIQAKRKVLLLENFGEPTLAHLFKVEVKFKRELVILRLLKRKTSAVQVIKELKKEGLLNPESYVYARISYDSFKDKLEREYNHSFKKVSDFEEFTAQKFYAAARIATKSSVMNLTTIYSFMTLKELEIQKLRTMALEKFGEGF